MNSCLFQVACLSFVYLAIGGTLGCDRDTGPAGVTDCFLGTPYYSKYQCGTCITDAYMRQRSKGRHQCLDTTATYCYYQCMLERYDLDQGPVYDDCLCDANSPLPQPSVILPASCYSPDGTDCGWYRQCLARMFPCTGQAEYAISYGEKFCNLYTDSTLEFSQKALQWIDATRRCLQVALVPLLHLCQVQPTCEEIKTMAFESHVPCYVDPYQGISVCSLSPQDWARIFWTIKSSFLPSTFVETFEASVLTAFDCGLIWSTQFAKYLYILSVRVWESLRKKRDTGGMLSDDELAHAIVLDISSSLQWSQNSTIDWYAFAVNTSAFLESPTTPSADLSGRLLIIQLFVVDRVDVGLLNDTDAMGRQRLNETITELSDAIEEGLTGTVDNCHYAVMSMRQCTSSDDIINGCSNVVETRTTTEKSTTTDDRTLTIIIAASVAVAGTVLILVAIVCVWLTSSSGSLPGPQRVSSTPAVVFRRPAARPRPSQAFYSRY